VFEGQAQFDEKMMGQALREAEAALEAEDVPVGAVIVHQGQIIGRGRNQRELLQDPTAHAEMIAITAAAEALHSWRLTGCTIYVTLEPCTMCAGAIVNARIDRLVFGAVDPKAGACGSVYNVVEDTRLNHRVQLTSGVLAPQCGDLLREFFARQRAMGKK
jgi:tRNA(adenine34) deaminase